MKTKHYFRARDCRNEVVKLYEEELTRGKYLGFDSLDLCYTLRNRATTYIYGAPFSGKTEFWFECLANLSELYGYKHAIYSPETGDRQEIIAELISKHCRKPFYKDLRGQLSEQELYRALDWIDEYFFFIDPDKDISPEDRST
jgi:hypothetical protein